MLREEVNKLNTCGECYGRILKEQIRHAPVNTNLQH